MEPPAPRPTVAVSIPAFNEAEGIGEFVAEIDQALAGMCAALHVIVVDDCSTDATPQVLEALAPKLAGSLYVVRMPRNSGHGPTALEAYRRALATGAEYILAVDGDGQFLGADLRRLLVLLMDGGDGVCGVRRFRYDPWFRMLMTRFLRLYLSTAFSVPTRDANCPLRGYRAAVLRELLEWVPAEAGIPNVHLTVVAARRGATLIEVDVTHRVRRGASTTGTMFASRRRSGVLGRLARFSWRALGESMRFRTGLLRGIRPEPNAAINPGR